MSGLRGALATSGLYWRTVSHLRPEQLLHRVRLRGQRLAMQRRPDLVLKAWSRPTPALGSWPPGFVPLEARLAHPAASAVDSQRGTFSFLGERHDLGRPAAWEAPGTSLLWRYNLHYWDWAWALVGHADRGEARSSYAALGQSWAEASPFGSWPAWAPYPVSLRAWAWCGQHAALVAGSADEGRFCDLLAHHLTFLRHNLEFDVGGNHLVKNLKGLLGLAVFFSDGPLVDEAVERLAGQVRLQVLPDGGHYERSPSYHCQVLGDLLDVRGLLQASGRDPQPFEEPVASMQRWLGVVLTSRGELAEMNDSWVLSGEAIALLGPALEPQPSAVALASSGYVVLRNERAQCIVDVGDPCPPDLPAHAQADCLSFELAVDGHRVVLDPGTTTYAGPQRAWERSTSAHNTVTVDGQDQTEVWGSFRAGRLAPAHLDVVDGGDEPAVVAHHTGYVGLDGSPLHRRTVQLRHHALEVTDELVGSGRHHVSMAIEHIDLLDGGALAITLPAELQVSTEQRGGRRRTVAAGDIDLPARWLTTLRF